VKAVTEELCGHEFSSATISRIVHSLDEELQKFAIAATAGILDSAISTRASTLVETAGRGSADIQGQLSDHRCNHAFAYALG